MYCISFNIKCQQQISTIFKQKNFSIFFFIKNNKYLILKIIGNSKFKIIPYYLLT